MVYKAQFLVRCSQPQVGLGPKEEAISIYELMCYAGSITGFLCYAQTKETQHSVGEIRRGVNKKLAR